MINPTEQFIAFLEKQNEPALLSFLKSLTNDQKKKLAPDIKKLIKDYTQFGQLSGNSYGHVKGTNVQRELLQVTAFVCFDRISYDKTPYAIWMLDKDKLSRIIDWYCPSWFNDFVNKQGSLDFVPHYLNYDWLMELGAKGFLQPSKELLVKVMPQMVFEQDSNRNWQFKPEKLLTEKITLEEHIWYLFEAESNIHYSDRYLRFEEGITKEKTGWIVVFKKYMDESLLDRYRLMKESLLASNRNFNKVLSGWFAQLFTELNPTLTDCLRLQYELFSVLSSPQSKAVHTALKYIKDISAEKEFDTGSFLDAIPVLLSSDTKAIVLASLTIAEKLAQQHAALRERILFMVCQCFIHADEALQLKSGKIIVRYGNATNPSLRNEVGIFYPSMLSPARQLLTSFYDPVIENENINDDRENSDPTQHLPPAEIVFPVTIDDLFFLASQAFDNNESWNIDLLPAALIHFQPQLKETDIQRFEPAFQRAFVLLKGGSRSNHGYLDSLMAHFFIDYGNWLIKTFPSAIKSIEKMYKSHDTKSGEKISSFLVSPTAGSYTANWEIDHKMAMYTPYKELLLAALKKIAAGDALPLLSTPTFEPCWLSPVILADRLYSYQQSGIQPFDVDLQIAVSRCYLSGNSDDAEDAVQKLSGELRHLVNFLLTDVRPTRPAQYKAAWMVASLTRREKKKWPEFESLSYNKYPINNYTGDLKWESVVENYSYRQYDYQTKSEKDVPATRKSASVHREYEKAEKKGLKKFFTNLVASPKDDPPMLYAHMNYRVEYLSIEHNDMQRLLSLIPNNPESLLADTFNKCLRYPEFWDETVSLPRTP